MDIEVLARALWINQKKQNISETLKNFEGDGTGAQSWILNMAAAAAASSRISTK